MTDPATERPLRLLVVDDHEVVRQGLVALLDRRAGFEVVAEAGTVTEAIAEAARFEPDVSSWTCASRTEPVSRPVVRSGRRARRHGS